LHVAQRLQSHHAVQKLAKLTLGMEDQLGALGIARNAVEWLNTLYIDAAVGRLEAEGKAISTEIRPRLSLLNCEHITFQGRYSIVRSHEEAVLRAAAGLGCPDAATAAACLRSKPFEQLTGLDDDQVYTVHRRIAELPWLPVTGTAALPMQPSTALRLGRAADVPLIQGGTRDEKAFADRLVGFWARFATTGSPGPRWQAYGHGTVLSFAADRVAPVNLADEHRCVFWAARR
jgi:carboxylesterase type B